MAEHDNRPPLTKRKPGEHLRSIDAANVGDLARQLRQLNGLDAHFLAVTALSPDLPPKLLQGAFEAGLQIARDVEAGPGNSTLQYTAQETLYSMGHLLAAETVNARVN